MAYKIMVSIVVFMFSCKSVEKSSAVKDEVIDNSQSSSVSSLATENKIHCVANFACTKNDVVVKGTVDNGVNFFASEDECISDLRKQVWTSAACSGSEFKLSEDFAYMLPTNVVRKLVILPSLVRYHNGTGPFIGKGICAIRVKANMHAQFLKRILRGWSGGRVVGSNPRTGMRFQGYLGFQT